LGKVHESGVFAAWSGQADAYTRTGMRRTRDRLCACRVCNVYELFQEYGMFVVIPVAEDDCELVVIGVYFFGWMKNQRGAQTVDVVALIAGVRGINLR
jgi:hypothetical protein